MTPTIPQWRAAPPPSARAYLMASVSHTPMLAYRQERFDAMLDIARITAQQSGAKRVLFSEITNDSGVPMPLWPDREVLTLRDTLAAFLPDQRA